MTYSHTKIEKKWQKIWKEKAIFKTDITDWKKPKFYILDMFPYPSGSGLHVGHLRGYLATDIITRIKIMQGYNVFHPMGFDSFGLPTEQYSIKTGKDPISFTEKNIQHFWQQLESFGFTYDQAHIIKTHEPNYYKWTQWAFLKMWEKKLTVQKNTTVNYCPKLNTVLANEEIVELNGQMVSERGSYPVVKKEAKQWVIKITNFAHELIDGLKTLDWPTAIKYSQMKWIGKNNGYLLHFSVQNKKKQISIFIKDWKELNSTHFVLLAINNKIIDNYLSLEIKNKIQKIRKEYTKKPLQVDKKLDKQPLGLVTNLFILNPINQKKIPICFAQYIDANFATGMRLSNISKNIKDWFFAFHHQIINQNILKTAKQNKVTKNNNDFEFNKIIKKKLLKANIKTEKITFYNLHDWIFARQRYWGEPFPVVHKENKIIGLSEKKLPLKLPKISNTLFLKKNQISPLAEIKAWTKKGYDVNTMPQWAGSCWYFLAYLLKKSDNTFWPLNSPEAKKILNHWMPVDLYVGGQEHAVSHLLYSRFWNHFLVEIGCHNHKEPFKKLLNQGLILAHDGKKMSKSRGNVVDPNSFLLSHGADALRLWEKFLGPFSQKIYWKEEGLDAMRKWLSRVYRLFIVNKKLFTTEKTNELEFVHAKMIKKVNENYNNFNFNVVISELMSFINLCYKSKKINILYAKDFLKLLHPICPYLTEEIWFLWKEKKILIHTSWPKINEKKLVKEKNTFAIQINGKTKKIINFKINEKKEQIIEKCKVLLFNKIKKTKIKKIIFIKQKVVNFVLVNK